MKNRRHKMIREIVENQNIETQFQLTEALRIHGFNVTQATISRDIKELGLVKVAAGSNNFRYGFPPGVNTVSTYERAKRVLHDSLLRVDVGHDLVVLKTMPGMAQGVGSCLDSLDWTEIVGVVAGDDTIFVAVGDDHDPKSLAERLRELTM